MKRTLLVLLPLLVLCAGCIPLIIGGAAGALGAYAISSDTVQGETDSSFENVWSSAYEVCRIRGNIKEEDSLRGYLMVETDSGKVWVRVMKLTDATTRLKISARKMHLPSLRLAQELYVKIIDQSK